MSTHRDLRLGIVGATGAVGRTAIEILEDSSLPIAELRLFCSQRSLGESLEFKNQPLATHLVEGASSFHDLDYCIFSAGSAVSRECVPVCQEAGCVAIDNTSEFRMEAGIPLVVPEVNPGDLAVTNETGLVANPNCSTIQMVVALAPLHAQFGLRKVVVSTYQAASGAGTGAMDELSGQVSALYNQTTPTVEHFPHQLAFNCIPQIGAFDENGYSEEETKMVNETRKILRHPNLSIEATCVRVPTFCSHSESIYIETEKPLPALDAVRELLSEAPGVQLFDEPETNLYPMPLPAIGHDAVQVGRLRKSPDNPNGLNLWVVADNLRKGAALNAVQIIETLTAQLH